MEALEAIVSHYLRTTTVLVVVLDPWGRTRYVNDAVTALLGRDPTGGDWFEAAVPPEQRAARRRRFAGILGGEIALPAPIEADARGAGGVRRIEWRTELLRDPDGTITGTISSGVDVTERALLSELTRAVALLEDPREAICTTIARLTGAASAVLWEPAGEGLPEPTARHGEPAADRHDGAEAEAAATALQDVRPFVVRGQRTVLCQPVVHAERPLGVLTVGWTRDDPPAAAEADLVALAAQEASIALQRLWVTAALRTAALSDPLTGVGNRRAWGHELPLELARAARSGRPLTVLVLDLNDFKALNDRSGHAAGDRLLRAATAAWSSELRAVDTLARLGGDEFAVLLPDCDALQAERVAVRLRELTPHGPGCAIGAATWDREEAADELVARADSELYANKAEHTAERLHDPVRLAAVRATGLATARTGSDELDRIAELAAWLLEVPVSLVTLVTEQRQAFAGLHGLRGWAAEERGTPLSHSFCRHPVATRAPLVVDDARLSPLLSDNPAIEDLGVVAYAGVPLVGEAGDVVGVLCAIDRRPRVWHEDDLAILTRLAQRAAGVLATP